MHRVSVPISAKTVKHAIGDCPHNALVTGATHPTTQREYHERILRVLIYIQQHLDEAVSLDELARVAYFSPYHFHRIFRGMVGESVMEHIRRLRFERAAFHLKAGHEPVTRIAFDAGYETHEAFTRAFRAMFDRSPTEFRRERQPSLPVGGGKVRYIPAGAIQNFIPIEKGENVMQVRIESIAPAHVAFVRHLGPYDRVGQAWGRLFAWAGPRGLCGPRMQAFGLCYDDPDVTPADKIRYDACFVVGPDVKPEADIGIQDVPGGDFAVALHKGPYSTLTQTYAMLIGQWLPASGRTPGPLPSIERYLNNPQTTPESELLTEVCIRLA